MAVAIKYQYIIFEYHYSVKFFTVVLKIIKIFFVTISYSSISTCLCTLNSTVLILIHGFLKRINIISGLIILNWRALLHLILIIFNRFSISLNLILLFKNIQGIIIIHAFIKIVWIRIRVMVIFLTLQKVLL